MNGPHKRWRMEWVARLGQWYSWPDHIGMVQLDDYVIYISCKPCPMCLGAMNWARPKSVLYASNQADAAAIDFDDALIYPKMEKEARARSIPFVNLMRPEALSVFRKWWD